jgi:uncharacterized protein YjbI with pentapeptide repeats
VLVCVLVDDPACSLTSHRPPSHKSSDRFFDNAAEQGFAFTNAVSEEESGERGRELNKRGANLTHVGASRIARVLSCLVRKSTGLGRVRHGTCVYALTSTHGRRKQTQTDCSHHSLRITHASLTAHHSRITRASLTHRSLRITHASLTHHSRITHASLTHRSLRITHASLTHHSRIAHASLTAHHSRITHASLTHRSLRITHCASLTAHRSRITHRASLTHASLTAHHSRITHCASLTAHRSPRVQGWSVAISYVCLLVLILFAYLHVYIKELGYVCICNADRYQRANKHCCTRVFGKSFLLMW